MANASGEKKLQEDRSCKDCVPQADMCKASDGNLFTNDRAIGDHE